MSVPTQSARRTLHLLAVLIVLTLTALPAPAQDRPADTLHKFNESVDALIKRVSPSVVQILVTGYGTLEEIGRASCRERVCELV